MINKLTRFVAFAVIAALTTVGCARHVTVVPPPAPASPPIIVRVPPPPAPIRAWSVDSIPGWKLTDKEAFDETDTDVQVVARYASQISEDSEAVALVVLSSLEGEAALTYLHDMHEAATSRDPASVKILGVRTTKHGDIDALEVLEANRAENGVTVRLSAALTDGKTGFFIVCGGDVREGQAVLEACKPLVRSFRAGK